MLPNMVTFCYVWLFKIKIYFLSHANCTSSVHWVDRGLAATVLTTRKHTQHFCHHWVWLDNAGDRDNPQKETGREMLVTVIFPSLHSIKIFTYIGLKVTISIHFTLKPWTKASLKARSHLLMTLHWQYNLKVVPWHRVLFLRAIPEFKQWH